MLAMSEEEIRLAINLWNKQNMMPYLTELTEKVRQKSPTEQVAATFVFFQDTIVPELLTSVLAEYDRRLERRLGELQQK